MRPALVDRRWFLPALGGALVVLLAALVACELRPPAGFSPRLGEEPDVSPFFPAIWRLLPVFSGRGWFQLATVAIMVALWVTYAGVLALLRRPRADRRRDLATVVAVTVAAHLLLLLAPPFGSNDIFHYAVFGRMVNRTGLNPYLTPGAALAPDAILPYATWPELSSHYGPAFTWLSALAAWLGGDGVFATALCFKGLAVAFSLGACWVLRRLAIELHGGDGTWTVAAYAWNPLVLIESAAMGHNDTVMIFLALAGLLLAVRGRPWLGFAALVVSADIKLLTGVVALLFAVNFVAAAPDALARVRRAAGLAALTVAVMAALWIPFWDRWRAFATARQLLFDPTKVQGASLGSARLAVAIAFAALLLVAVRQVVRAPLARLTGVAAGVMLAFVVLFPWRWTWYSMPPLALFSLNHQTRPQRMLIGVVVLWGAILMLRYTFLHPPAGEH